MKQRGLVFFQVLGKSAKILTDSALELSCLLEGDFKDFSKKVEKISTLQKETKMIYSSYIKQLENSFITPIDREDLIAIFTKIEKIIIKINQTAVLINLSQVTDIRPGAKDMARHILSAGKLLEESIKNLHNFKKSKAFREPILKLRDIIKEAELTYNSSVKRLFIEERNAIMLVKWIKIYDLESETLIFFENAAKTIEAVVIKNL